MAHKKGVGSSKNGRESAAQRLGTKIWDGQQIVAGNIIVRQRGNRHYPGQNVGQGKDDTLYALTNGVVFFDTTSREKKFVSVLSPEDYAKAAEVRKAKKEKYGRNARSARKAALKAAEQADA